MKVEQSKAFDFRIDVEFQGQIMGFKSSKAVKKVDKNMDFASSEHQT